MLHAYYSNGKGKTSAANGIALRALGGGMKVLYTQFLKNGDSLECNILKKLDNLTMAFCKTRYELFDSRDTERKNLYCKAYSDFLDEIELMTHRYDMIILDEVLDALYFEYVTKDRLTQYLEKFKDTKEIILTGHSVSDEILSLCDYASEISHIKHPYEKGVAARKGIEY